MIKKYIKKGMTLIETLLILAILSVALVPLVHIINMASPSESHADDEYLAVLFAHHVIEEIIAKRALNPNFLPTVCQASPIVLNPEDSNKVNEYFNYFEEFKGAITEKNSPQLYWAMKKYKCKVDTYLLDSDMFKVIVYVSYLKEGREIKVYLERLLPNINNIAFDNKSNNEEDGENSNE